MSRFVILISAIACLFVAPTVRGGTDCTALLDEPAPMSWMLGPAIAEWYAKLEAGEQARYMIIGDSMSVRTDSYNWYLVRRLRERYGDGGDGYFGIASGFTAPNPANDSRAGPRFPQKMLRSEGGNRVAFLNFPREEPAGTYQPDGLFAQIWDEGWIDLQVHGTRVTLFYLVEDGGGAFSISLNGQVLDTIYTQADLPGTAMYEIDTGAPDNDTVSTIRLATTTPRPVQVHGVMMESDDPGVIYHRIGRGGQGPDDFLRSVNKPTRRILLESDPDLVFVMLDWSGEEKFEFYEQEMNELLDFYESTLPDASFVLMTHHPFEPPIAAQVPILRRIACERGHGFINLHDTFSGFDEMDDLGFIEDSVHFTGAGGSWFGDYVFDLLMAAGEQCRGDVNRDGMIDFADLNLLLSTWSGTGDADLDRNGIVDFTDLNFILQTWGNTCP